MDPLKNISTRTTPQSEPADSRQVKNNAGGYTFELEDLQRLRRFLILGTEGGTFYVGQHQLTRDNANVVFRMAENQPRTLVDEVVSVSLSGKAPKQNPTLFALAVASALPKDAADRSYALAQLNRVARTGTHLFQFIAYVKQFRGHGRALNTALKNWYLNKPVDRLAYQAVKYRQREGWTHADVLRLAKPVPEDASRDALFAWITAGATEHTHLEGLEVVRGYELAKEGVRRHIPSVVREYGLTWEMVPTESLNDPEVWRALFDVGIPYTALMRQLPRLTRLGLTKPMMANTLLPKIVSTLTNAETIKHSRVHPLQILVALRTYASSTGFRSSAQDWSPTQQVVDALDEAFYLAFDNVEPTGGNTLLALDVSGSMTWHNVANSPLTCRDAAAAMALVTAKAEKSYAIMGFTAGSYRPSFGRLGSGLSDLEISPKMRLDNVISTMNRVRMGGTDCALPMIWATNSGAHIDTFVIYTDNETWAGKQHPHQALQEYRRKVNPEARLAVVGMASTGFSIADPSDPGSLDVVGFDTGTPQLLSDFARGVI